MSEKDITIDKEFAALIPPLTTDELAGLEENLLRDGIRDALVAWDGKNILLDGHNRFRLAQKHSLVYRVKTLKFETRDEAKVWIINNQLGRRNLTPDQASYLRGVEYNMRKKSVGRPEKECGKNCHINERTEETLAKKHGVSPRTIRNDAEFAEAVDALDDAIPGVREKVLSGEGPPRHVVIAAAKHEDKAEAAKLLDTTPHVARNSGESEWYTPEEYVEAARKVMGGIDLDPASCKSANAIVKAKKFYSAEDDGLTLPWHGRVFLNPPYGQPLMAKFAAAVVEKHGKEFEQAIVLVNNATETDWFQSMLRVCNCVCFPRGRIRFIDRHGNPSSTPLQGQAFLYFGTRVTAFKSVFKKFGCVVWHHE